MTKREEIKRLHAEGMQQWEIAEKVSASRNYVCKVVNNYWNGGRKGREDKYVGFDKCELCSAQARHLHHKDFNNANDDKSNLQPVCTRCHGRLHREERQRTEPKYMSLISDEKKVEIMEYNYSFKHNGGLGWGSGVCGKYNITYTQFKRIEEWYVSKYGKPEFNPKDYPRRGWIELPDDATFSSNKNT